jgi:hypothetical protein
MSANTAVMRARILKCATYARPEGAPVRQKQVPHGAQDG